jgi:hypothetical protein
MLLNAIPLPSRVLTILAWACPPRIRSRQVEEAPAPSDRGVFRTGRKSGVPTVARGYPGYDSDRSLHALTFRKWWGSPFA